MEPRVEPDSGAGDTDADQAPSASRAGRARLEDSYYHELFDNLTDAVVLLSADDRVLEVNRAFERIFGYSDEEACGRPINELIVPSQRDTEANRLSERVRGGEMVAAETVRSRKGGALVDVRVLGYPLFRDGRQIGIFGIYSDITMRRRVERTLRLQGVAMDSAANAIFITTRDGNIEWVNRAFTELTGYPEEEILGRTPEMLESKESPGALDPHGWQRLAAGEVWRRQVVARHKSGRLFTVEQTVEPLVDPRSGIDHFVVVQEDISDRLEAERRIHHMARHDSLTDLPNRYAFGEQLESELDRVGRSGGPVAAMILDLDHFKDINDSYGHAVGDGLLVAVAGRLRRRLRKSVCLARFGGDEFGIIPTGLAGFDDASELAQDLLEAFREPFALSGQEIYVSASLGIAIYPPGPSEARSLIKRADMALYRAKADGRDSFRFYEQEMDREVRRRMWMGQELRGALERRELFLEYQPQLWIETGEIRGVEALLRWRHSARGLVPTDEFITAAEAGGAIVPIGEWVLRTACAQAQSWQREHGLRLRVGVNLSAVQFRDSRLVETVEEALAESGLAPELLELELTEGILMRAGQPVEMAIERLRKIGVRFALDDFGKGYSSLEYVRRFHLDRLKIDRSFVQGIREGMPDPVIVSLVTVLGKKLGLEVIAEGVETSSQLDFLAAEGCRQVQGFYFSRPLPADQIDRLLCHGSDRIAPQVGPRRLRVTG
jgi:diguanylate cyclase (GGDEF)-like protein/PAS domain S-box-containing protein